MPSSLPAKALTKVTKFAQVVPGATGPELSARNLTASKNGVVREVSTICGTPSVPTRYTEPPIMISSPSRLSKVPSPRVCPFNADLMGNSPS